MDSDKQKKRQSLRIIVSEALMVLTVVVMVTVLAFVVSGYWINSDFKVERQGMLQISSTPSGASVEIDGDTSWLQRTNTSKVLTSGEHEIKLSKDGYDTWSKTINIKEGLLYRLHYPRLFPNNMTADKMESVTGATMAIVSSDHNSLLLPNNTTKWTYYNLNSDKLEPKTVDISKYFTSVSPTEDLTSGLFNAEIVDADWDFDGNHVLFEVRQGELTEWVLINVRDVNKSINLTKEFNAEFSHIEILDNSANNLLAIRNGNLHKIDVSNRQISAILVENVINFDHYNNEIVFTAEHDESIWQNNAIAKYYVGYFKLGDNKTTELETFEIPVKAVISKFYDTKYITILSDNQVIVHHKDNYSESTNHELSSNPDTIEVGHDGEFIIMYSGNNIATLDMEADTVREWTIENENFGWIDNDMIYVVSEGDLIVYDYDGYNRRSIARNASSHFPVSITDNKWLYYFSDDELMRVWLVEH